MGKYLCVFSDEPWQVFGYGAGGMGVLSNSTKFHSREKLIAHNRMNHLENPALTPSPARHRVPWGDFVSTLKVSHMRSLCPVTCSAPPERHIASRTPPPRRPRDPA